MTGITWTNPNYREYNVSAGVIPNPPTGVGWVFFLNF